MEVLEAWTVVNLNEPSYTTLDRPSYELWRGDCPGIYMENEHPTCMGLSHEFIPVKEDPRIWSLACFFSLVLIYINVVAGPLLVKILELSLFHVEFCPMVGKSYVVQKNQIILV